MSKNTRASRKLEKKLVAEITKVRCCGIWSYRMLRISPQNQATRCYPLNDAFLNGFRASTRSKNDLCSRYKIKSIDMQAHWKKSVAIFLRRRCSHKAGKKFVPKTRQRGPLSKAPTRGTPTLAVPVMR